MKINYQTPSITSFEVDSNEVLCQSPGMTLPGLEEDNSLEWDTDVLNN